MILLMSGNIIVGIIDAIMIDFLSCKFIAVGKYREFLFRNKTISLVCCGIISGVLRTLLNSIGVETYKFITHFIYISLIIICWQIYEFKEIFIIYILINYMIFIVQIFVYIILSFLSLENIMILGQSLSLIIIILVCHIIDISKIFETIERDIVPQLLFFLISIAIFITIIFINSNFNFIKILVNLTWYIFIAISLFILKTIFSQLYYYTKKLPKKHHEYKNVLANIYINASTKDIKGVQQSIQKYLNILEIPFEPFDEHSENHPILIFIKSKLAEKQVDAEINFMYHTPNLKVTDEAVSTMLGILLDNAIRATTDKKLIINVEIDALMCFIKVGNQIQPDIDIEKIFAQDGFTSNKEVGHGYGLSNLKDIVNYINGTIEVFTQVEDETTYAFFEIKA